MLDITRLQTASLRDAPFAYARHVKDMSEGRMLLNSDPNVLVTYIPLNPNCKRVKNFGRAVRDPELNLAQKFFRADMLGGEEKNANIIPLHLRPFGLSEAPKVSGSYLLASPERLPEGATQLTSECEERYGLCVLTEDGRLINFHTDTEELFYSLIVQSTKKQYVNPGFHRDDGGDIRNDNFYAEGPGVGYEIGEQLYSLPGPCITQHRGLSHPFVATHGESTAVDHTAMPLQPGQQKINFVRTIRDPDVIRFG